MNSTSFALFKAVYPLSATFDWSVAQVRFSHLSLMEQALAVGAASVYVTDVDWRRRSPTSPVRFLRERRAENWPRRQLFRRVELLCRLGEVIIEHLAQHGDADDRNNRIAQLVMNLRPGCAEDEAQQAAIFKHLNVVAEHLERLPFEALAEACFLLDRLLLVIGHHSQSPSVGFSAPMVAESGAALPFAPGSARSFDPGRAADILKQARAS